MNDWNNFLEQCWYNFTWRMGRLYVIVTAIPSLCKSAFGPWVTMLRNLPADCRKAYRMEKNRIQREKLSAYVRELKEKGKL